MTKISSISTGDVYKANVTVNDVEQEIQFYTTIAEDKYVTVNIEKAENSDLIGESVRIFPDGRILETLSSDEIGTVNKLVEKLESL